jgi:hypothetical protein
MSCGFMAVAYYVTAHAHVSYLTFIEATFTFSFSNAIRSEGTLDGPPDSAPR